MEMVEGGDKGGGGEEGEETGRNRGTRKRRGE